MLQLDPAARGRVEAACHVVNQEIAQQRSTATFACALIGLAAVPLLIAYPFAWRFTLFGALVLAGLVVERARRQVSSLYKRLVMQRVVKALGGDLSYRPQSSLTQSLFEQMDLFPITPNRFTSEDEVCGRKENVAYTIREVRARRKEGKTERVVFNGLLVGLEFNKNFSGHTVVVPDREGRALGGLLGDTLERSSIGRKQIVRLENPDFERLFSVYSTDDQEARYLLTPKLMELILEANALQQQGIRLAFRDSFLHVAVPRSGNLMEAGLMSTVTPEGALGDLVTVMQLAERLVATLDLETRIWSRA